jgi:hypothetical protein
VCNEFSGVCSSNNFGPDCSTLSSSGHKELPCSVSACSSGASGSAGASGDFTVKLKDIGLCTLAWSHRQVHDRVSHYCSMVHSICMHNSKLKIWYASYMQLSTYPPGW